MRQLLAFLFVIILSISGLYSQNNYRSINSGNWSDNTIWEFFNGSSWVAATQYPGQNAGTNQVSISSGHSVVVDINVANSIASFTFGSNAANSSLTLNSGSSLTISGSISYTNPSADNTAQTIDVGAGSLSSGSIVMAANTGTNRTNNFTASTGSISTGSITFSSASNNLSFTGAATLSVTGNISGAGTFSAGAATINVGGSFSGFSFTSGTSTINFNGGAQTVGNFNYYHLRLSGTGTKTLQTGTTTIGGNLILSGSASTITVVGLTISGNLQIGDGCSFTMAGFNTTVTGTTTVGGGASGNLVISSNVGTKIFTGLISLNSGASWNNSGNSPITIRGGITNNGTFTDGTGMYTFDNNNQDLNGTLSIRNITVTVVNLSNYGTLTTNTSFAGSGTFIQTNTSVLNLGGAVTINSLNASAGTNTVNFTGAAQSIPLGTYQNLSLSGSNNKTIAGVVTVNSSLSMSGSASLFCGTNDLTLNGGVSFSSSGTMNAGANNVVYNSSSAQDIIPGTYGGSLSLQGTGAKTLKGASTVTGAFNLASDLSNGTNAFTLNGSTTINSGSITSGANIAFNNAVNYTAGTITTTAGTVTYTYNSPLTIIPGTYGGNLTLSGTGIKNLGGTTTITGAFNQTAGSLACGVQNIIFSGSVANSGAFSTGVNIVTYNGAGAQNIIGGTYTGNLNISGGTKTLLAATTVNGDFNQNANLSCANLNLTLNGNANFISGVLSSTTATINLNNVVTVTSASYSSTGGSVIFNNAVAQDIIPGTYGGALTLNGASTKSLKGSTSVGGTFTLAVAAGALNCGSNDLTLTGATTYTSGSLSSAATVSYSGAVQTILPGTYTNLTIAGSNDKSLSAATRVDGILNFSSRNLSLGAFNLSLGASANITGYSSSAKIIAGGAGSIIKEFTAAGTYTFPVSTAAGIYTPAVLNIATATIAGTASVSLNCIAAKAPSQLDNTYSLNKYWTLSSVNLSNTSGSLELIYDETERNAGFEPEYLPAAYNGSTWALGALAEVEKTTNTITFNFSNASINGNYTSGPDFSFTVTSFYSLADGTWETPASWSRTGYSGAASSIIPPAGSNVFIGNNRTITINTPGTAKNSNTLTIENTGTLTLGAVLPASSLASVLTGNGKLRIGAGIFPVAPVITTNNFITNAGSRIEFYNNANYTLPASLSSCQSIEISGGGTKTLSTNLNLAENLIVTAGNLELSTFNIAVTGSSTLTGAITDNNIAGTNNLNNVNFTNGSISSSATSNFTINDLNCSSGTGTIGQGNFSINGVTNIASGRTFTISSLTGTKTFSGDITVDGTWTNSGNSPVTISGNLIVNNGSSFTAASSTGMYTFNGASKTISGTSNALGFTNATITGTIATSIAGVTFTNLTITNPGVFTNNSNSLSISTLFSGSGNFVQGLNSKLNLGITNAANFNIVSANLDFTSNSNTVEYTAGNQPVKDLTYSNLILTGAGNTKTTMGAVTVNSTFTCNTGTLTLATYNLNLKGPVSWTAGLINTAANIVDYNSASAQDIIPGVYTGTLTIQGTGDKTLKSTTTANGVFNMNSNLNCGNNNFTLSNTVNYTSGSFVNGTNTVSYTGTIAQNIIPANYSTLSLSGAASAKSLMGTTIVGGAFTLNTGSLACGINNLTLSGSVTHTAGTFTTGLNIVTYNNPAAQNMLFGTYTGDVNTSGGAKTLSGATIIAGTFSNDANLTCGGQNISFNGPVSYVSGAFSSTGGTALYSSASLQDIIPGTYGGAISLQGTGDKSLKGSTFLNGAFTMNANLNSGNYDLSIAGTVTHTSGILSCGLNTVSYTTGTQTLIGTTYNNLSISGNNIWKNPDADVIVSGTYTQNVITAGGINGASYNLTFNGPVVNTAGTINTNAAKSVTYGYAGSQNVIAATYNGFLLFTNSGTRVLLGNTSILQSLIIPSGITFDLNGKTLTSSQDITINGQLDVVSLANSSAQLLVANTRNVLNNGVMRVIGTATYPAIMNRNGAGTYSITQNIGGAVFHAKYGQFNYLTQGITISSGSIDNTNNFSKCVFQNCTGNQYLNLSGLDLSGLSAAVDSVNFVAGPLYNVNRTSGTGAIVFSESFGARAGEAFDLDNGNPGSLINWTYPSRYYYSVNSGSANNPVNWQNASGVNPPLAHMTSGDRIFVIKNNLTMTVDASSALDFLQLWVGDGSTGGTLVVGADANQAKLTVRELLDVKTNGTINAGTMGTIPGSHKLYVYGNLQNAGAISLQNTSVNVADLEIIGITSKISGNTPVLNNLLIQNSTNNAKLTAECNLNILGNVIIGTNSEFQDGGNTHTVGGTWTENAGGLLTGSGTIEFGGNNQIGGTAPIVFNNVIVSGSNLNYLAATTTNGSFTAINGTQISASGNNQTYNGNFNITAGSKYSSTQTIIFDGTAAQNLRFDGDLALTNLTFQNTGLKTIYGNISANGLFYILNGATIAGDGTGTQNHILAGGMRVDGICNLDGTLTFTGGTITTGNPSNNLSLGTAKVNIFGIVNAGPTAPATACTINTANEVDITFNPIVGNGYLILNNNTALSSTTASDFILNPNAGIYMRGNNTAFPSGFGNYNLDLSSYSVYDNAGPQTIKSDINYGFLYLRNLNDNTSNFVKTADGNIHVSSTLYFGNLVSFNTAGYNLNIAGNIQPYVAAATDAFILNADAGGTVSFDAPDANQTIYQGTYNFNNVRFTLDAPSSARTKTFNPGSTVSIKGDFTVSNTSPSFIHTVNLNDLALTPASSAKTFNLGEYCQLNTTNTDIEANFLNRFATARICDPNSIFYYSLNGNQSVATNLIYGNFAFAGGTKTPASGIEIKGYIVSAGGAGSLFNGNNLTHKIGGDWRLAATNYSYAGANDTIILNGALDQIVAGNAGFRSLVVDNTAEAILSGNTMLIQSDLKVRNGAKFNASQYSLNIGGNVDFYTSGQFTQTSGQTTFNGTTGNQTIKSNTNSYFGSLYVNKTGVQAVKALTNLNIRGNTTVSNTSGNAGILDITNMTVNFGGNLTIYNATDTSFKAGGGTVIFDGTNSQQFIQNYSPVNLTLNHLQIKGSTDKNWGSYYYDASPTVRVNGSTTVDIKGNVLIDGPNLYAGGWSGSTGWGWGVNFNVWGNWICNSSFTHTNNQRVVFCGTNQDILCPSFGSVVLRDTAHTGPVVKNLLSSTNVNGNLIIENGVTFNANNFDISVQYNWVNNQGGAFNYGTTGNTVTFTGANNGRIYTGITSMPATGRSFYNLVISKVAAGPNYNIYCYLTGILDIKKDLRIETGNFTPGNNDIWVGGDFTNTGEGMSWFTQNTGTVLNMVASGGNHIFNPGAANPAFTTFSGLNFNAPGANFTVLNDFNIQNNPNNALNYMVIQNGYLDLNHHKLIVNNNNQRINISGGGLELDSAAVLEFNPGGNANSQSLNISGGIFKITGSPASPSILRRSSTGNYTVNTTGGTIYARYYKIDGITGNGFTISGTATINPANNFSDGFFSGGGTAGAYLTFSGYAIPARDTIRNVDFSAPQANSFYNVAGPTAAGNNLVFLNYSGVWAGTAKESDPNNKVDWAVENGAYWDGNTDGDGDNLSWDDPYNWVNDVVPNSSSNVILDNNNVSSNYVVSIHNFDASAKRLTIRSNPGRQITLRIMNDKNLDINENLVILGANDSLKVMSANSKIFVSGNWSNSGVFVHGNGSVILDGSMGNYSVYSGGTVTKNHFYNLEENSDKNATYSLSSDLYADNKFTVTKGIFDVGNNYTIVVGGDFTILPISYGSFTCRNGIVNFNGAGNQNITGTQFYNFTTSGSGTKKLLSNISIRNTCTIGAGTTLDGQENTIFESQNWQNNGIFTQTGNGMVVFDGTVTQNIDNGAAPSIFNSIAFSNAGVKNITRSCTVNKDFIINSGSGNIDFQINQVTGTPAGSFSHAGNYIIIRGADNFPKSFGTYSISATSNVLYQSDLNQTIAMTNGWSYGNLFLADANAPGTSVKTCPAGDLTIAGNININDGRTTLDMATNDANMILTGTLNPAAGAIINWGTAKSTLTHLGRYDWGLSANITGFNNVIFGGTGYRFINANLNVTGNLVVRSGLVFCTYSNWAANLPFRVTGPGDTLVLEGGATINCPIPRTLDTAFLTGFSVYQLSDNSTVNLNSPSGVEQTVFTGKNIKYGNLDLGGGTTTKIVNSDGEAALYVKGSLNTNLAVYRDKGKNIVVGGANALINRYVPTPGTTITLNGVLAQTIRNAGDNVASFENLVFSGSGTKTFCDNTDNINIAGNFTINPGVTVLYNSGRIINFSGKQWNNYGIYTQTNGMLNFNGSSFQRIIPGSSDPLNYFFNLRFANTGAKKFVQDGANVNGTFSIADIGTIVYMNNLDHYLAGNDTIIAGSIWSTDSANLYFDGGNQQIITNTSLKARSISISGNGTKTMYNPWILDGDLSIGVGSTLNTGVASNNINLKGHWTNNGAFTCNLSKVTFDGPYTSGPVSINITSNGYDFFDLAFASSAPSVYYLLPTANATSTRVQRNITIASNDTLNLNSQTLVFGANNQNTKLFTLNGTLTINQNAYLRFDNRGITTNNASRGVLDVYGRLNVIGSDPTNFATISTVNNSGGNGSIINIQSGGTFAARYYLIENLRDSGLFMLAGSILDDQNNMSDGSWANLRNVANASFINLECTNYTGGDIKNVNFNSTFTPTVGTHFNVRRIAAVTPAFIRFKNVSGSLGEFKFEKDSEYPVTAPATGSLQWPAQVKCIWTGAINNNWHLAGNWIGGVPDSTLDAEIANVPNLPKVLVDTAWCRNLKIISGSLELNSGRKLMVSGDVLIGQGNNNAILAVKDPACDIYVKGGWIRGNNGTFVHGSSTVHFLNNSGSATIDPRNSDFYNIEINNQNTTFTLVGTPINIKGNLTITKGTLLPGNNNYIYNIYGNFINNGSFRNTVIGTVILKGTGVQNVFGGTFYHLTVNGSNTKIFNGICSVAGNTLVQSTLKAETACQMTFYGNVTIDTTGTFDDGNEKHYFRGGNWRGYGNMMGNGTITFVGNANPTIYDAKFNNIQLNGSGYVYVRGNVGIKTNAEVLTNPRLYVYAGAKFDNTSGAGDFTMASGTNIYVYDVNNFPSNYSGYIIAANTLTSYEGSVQNIAGVTYGNLQFMSSAVKTLTGDITVLGNLNFIDATLDVSANNYSINIYGNWYNQNRGTFVPRNGSVNCIGTNNQDLRVGALASNNFYNLFIDKSSGTVNANDNRPYTFLNNLRVENGTFNHAGHTIYVGNDLRAINGSFTNNGNYIFTKTTGSAEISTNNSQMGAFAFNGAASYKLLDALYLTGNLTQVAGAVLDANGQIVKLGDNSRNDVVTLSGSYIMGKGGRLELSNNTSLTVESTGSFEAVGDSANNVFITQNATWGGYYSFTVKGAIKARYYVFEYMNQNGVRITPTATIAPTPNNFSNGVFNNGYQWGTSSSCMLGIENTQTFTAASANGDIRNVSFPKLISNCKNVRKTATNTGRIEFYNADGIFAGPVYEDDPSGIIDWTGPYNLTWTGVKSSDWFDTLNWTINYGPVTIPTGNENVIIPSFLSTNYPIINKKGAITGHLNIKPTAYLTINTNDVGTSDPDLKVLGDLTVAGYLLLNSTKDSMTVSGNWTSNIGTVNNNGNVTFNGSSGSKNIYAGINNGFYNLYIAGTATYTIGGGNAGAISVIKNNLSILNGATLDVNSGYNYELNVRGNWSNKGNFQSRQGMVKFNPTSAAILNIDGGTSPFCYVMLTSNGGTYRLTGNTSVGRDLTISSGTTFDLNKKTLYFGDNVNNQLLNVYGTFVIAGGSTLSMGNKSKLYANNDGKFYLLGTNASEIATITHQGSNYVYGIEVDKAKIFAKYYLIDWVDKNGLYLNTNASFDAVNNMSDGTFTNGEQGGTYLKFDNNFSGTDTLKNIVFGASSTGSSVIGTMYNVTRSSGNPVIMADASGLTGDYPYEYDGDSYPLTDATSGKIVWLNPNTNIWVGGISSEWNLAGNWSLNKIPDSSKYVLIKKTLFGAMPSNLPLFSAAPTAKAKKLSIYSGLTLSISGTDSMLINEEIINKGSIAVNGASTATIKLGGDWNNTGAFSCGKSTVVLRAASGNRVINPNGALFYNLSINGGATAKYVLQSNTGVLMNLSVNSGTLTVNNGTSNYNLNIGGNLQNNANLTTAGGTITFDGTSGNYRIKPGSAVFNNLIIDAAATYSLEGNVSVNSLFELRRGTLNLSPDAGVTNYNLSLIKNLEMTSGSAVLNAFNSNIQVGDLWKISSGTFNCGTSTVLLLGNFNPGSKSISAGVSTNAFYKLLINSPAATTYKVSFTMQVNNTLDISSGSNFDLNSKTLNISGIWRNSGNFIPQLGTVVFNGSTQSIFKPAGTETFYNLTASMTDSLTLTNCDVVVKGNLNLTSGFIKTGTYKLTLGTSAVSTGTYTRSGGKVVGKLERWISTTPATYNFHIGTRSNLNTVSLTTVGGITGGSVLLEFVNAKPDSVGFPIEDGVASGDTVFNRFTDGYWNATALNSFACTNYNLVLNATGFSSFDITATTRILKRTNNAGNWFVDGTHADAANPSIYRNNLTGGISNAANGTQFCLGLIECKTGTIGVDQGLCSGATASALTSIIPAKAGPSPTFVWFRSTTETSITPAETGWTQVQTGFNASYSPGVVNVQTRYVRKMISSSCSVPKYSNLVLISILPTPVNKLYRLSNY